MKNISGGGLIAKMLKVEGVEVVFGIIDGTYFGLLAGLRDEGIRIITPRHETSAMHMAGAYAKMTGKLGVAMASNGPGAANVLPGVAVENGEGNRVLLITSCRRVGIAYPDRGGTFQYFNQSGVIKQMAKWSGTVTEFGRVPEMMKRAFRVSWKGRPGVVHVEAPESIMSGKFKFAVESLGAPSSYRLTEPIAPSQDAVRKAAELLLSARQPMIQAGTGVMHGLAWKELLEVAETLQTPVTTSWGGRGAIPETHDLSVPMIYLELTDKVRNESDVVLALGTRFGETDFWGKAPYWAQPSQQKLIQVDIDEDWIGVNKPVTVGVLSDIKLFLIALLDEIHRRGAPANLNERNQKVTAYAEARRLKRAELDQAMDKPVEGVHTARVVDICREVFGDDAILVIDGGNTAVWSNFYHEMRQPNTVLNTFKLGLLGAGPGQALGAKIACPDKQVYGIIADGAFGFQPTEIETAVRHNIPVVFIVISDRQWGMVKIGQQFGLKPLKTLIQKSLSPEETINTDFSEIRFDKLSESMGGLGIRVSRAEDLKPALEQAVASKRPAVIHVDVDPVAHMWAPGLKVFRDMHLEPKG